MAYQLRPFRDYDEHDVLNLFAYDTTNLTAGQIQVPKGVLVKIATGWKNYDSGAVLGGGIDFIGSAGAANRGAVAKGPGGLSEPECQQAAGGDHETRV